MVAQVGDFAEAAVADVAPAEKGKRSDERQCGQRENQTTLLAFSGVGKGGCVLIQFQLEK